MNDTLLDELRNLTNKDAMAERQAAFDAFRPKNRHPVAAGSGVFKIAGRRMVTGTRQNGATYETDSIAIKIEKLADVQVARGRDFYTEPDMEILVPVSERKNSQLGLMVSESGVEDITQLHNKQVTFTEAAKNNGKDKQGYDINIWYYKFQIVGAGNNGSAAPPAAITWYSFTDAEHDTLLAHMAGVDGPTFIKDAVKLELSPEKKSYVISRKYQQDAVALGKAELIDDVYQVRI